MTRQEPGDESRPTSKSNWKRPLLYDSDIETLLEGLGLHASRSVYNASEAYRLAKALVDPARGRRERWVEPHYTLSRFLGEIERMTRIHRARSRSRRGLAGRSARARPRPNPELSSD